MEAGGGHRGAHQRPGRPGLVPRQLLPPGLGLSADVQGAGVRLGW